MDSQTALRCEARAKVFKAMGHPTRFFILEKLAQQPFCVCELREMIGSDLSTVSKHLSVLKNAGLVRDEKNGTQVIYHLAVPCVMNFIGCVESVLENNAEKHRLAL